MAIQGGGRKVIDPAGQHLCMPLIHHLLGRLDNQAGRAIIDVGLQSMVDRLAIVLSIAQQTGSSLMQVGKTFRSFFAQLLIEERAQNRGAGIDCIGPLTTMHHKQALFFQIVQVSSGPRRCNVQQSRAESRGHLLQDRGFLKKGINLSMTLEYFIYDVREKVLRGDRAFRPVWSNGYREIALDLPQVAQTRSQENAGDPAIKTCDQILGLRVCKCLDTLKMCQPVNFGTGETELAHADTTNHLACQQRRKVQVGNHTTLNEQDTPGGKLAEQIADQSVHT